MDEPLASLSLLLSDVILPNLKAVQESQAQQIASNDRLEQAIEELRVHIEAQYAIVAAELTACRAELAATQAMLKAAQSLSGSIVTGRTTLVH
jgi:hypothetical protein